MKNLIIACCLLIFNGVYSQDKIVFYDSILEIPVKNVHVYSSSSDLIAMSNENGEIEINLEKLPFTIKSWGYLESTINTLLDTIYLEPKFQQINEVTIKPVDYVQFYSELITSASQKILNDTNTIIYGNYFESVLLIDLESMDSTYSNKTCDLVLVQSKSSKKIDYQFYPSNGVKYFQLEDKENKIDTNNITRMNAFIPKFSKMLKQDLSNPKKYKVKFSNKNASRDLGDINTLHINLEEDKYYKKINVNYIHEKVLTWENEYIGKCENIKEILNIKMCISNSSELIQFKNEDESYSLKNIIFNITIDFSVEGHQYCIKVVKAFLQNDKLNSITTPSVKNLDNYFETINYSEGKDELNLYQF